MDFVSIELSNDEALVLFDWLARPIEGGEMSIADQAEERTLWDLGAQLKATLREPLSSHYEELLQAARDRVRDPVDG
jgi:hypothetical protein